MATLNAQFKLKASNSKGEAQVFLRAYYEGIRLTYYLGIAVNPDYWMKDKQRLVESNKEFGNGKLPTGVILKNQDYNLRLTRYRAVTEKIYNHFRYEGIIPTAKQMTEELDKEFNQKKVEEQVVYLLPYIDDFIARSNKKRNTKKNYTTTRNHIEAFQTIKGRKFKLADVDLRFYEEWERYFIEHKKAKAVNTFGTNTKNLIVFLGDAENHGLTVNQDYKKKQFRIVSEEVEAVYLPIPEVIKIYDLDFSENPRLDRVRDLFLIGCFTGLRFSDYSQITKDHLSEEEGKMLLSVKTVKTGIEVVIPMNPLVIKIFEKYNWVMPRIPSNQKTNVYLKEIAREAKLKEKIPVHRTEGNLRVENSIEKSELISTHTARRTFATNAFLAGVPVLSIMKITGHTTETSFMKYIRMSAKDNAIKMADHPFFNQGYLRVVQ